MPTTGEELRDPSRGLGCLQEALVVLVGCMLQGLLQSAAAGNAATCSRGSAPGPHREDLNRPARRTVLAAHSPARQDKVNAVIVAD